MVTTKQFSKSVDEFKTAFKRGKYEQCAKLLTKLKIEMTQLPSLPPVYERTPMAQQENMLARDVLEHAVLLSIKLEDEDMFERNFLQLETYYYDQGKLLPPSQNEYQFWGLNLVRLLVQKRTAEFHTQLELIPPEAHSSEFIRYAVELEQCLMEGAYNKVLTSKHNLPASEYFSYFINQLETTVRDEIASCCEKAFSRLKVGEARDIMMFKTNKQVEDYAREMVELHKAAEEEQHAEITQDVDAMEEDTVKNTTKCGWDIKDGVLHFQPEASSSTKELSSMDVIKRTLIYAKELERIV